MYSTQILLLVIIKNVGLRLNYELFRGRLHLCFHITALLVSCVQQALSQYLQSQMQK